MAIVKIEMTVEQAKIVSSALDTFVRVHQGQFEEIRWLAATGSISTFHKTEPTLDHLDALSKAIDLAKAALEYPTSTSLGISNIHERGQYAYEILTQLSRSIALWINPSPDNESALAMDDFKLTDSPNITVRIEDE